MVLKFEDLDNIFWVFAKWQVVLADISEALGFVQSLGRRTWVGAT